MTDVAGTGADAVLALKVVVDDSDLTALPGKVAATGRKANLNPVDPKAAGQIRELRAALETSQREAETLRQRMEGLAKGTGQAGRVMASYRAQLDGMRVSAREGTSYTLEQVKAADRLSNAMRAQVLLGNEVTAMMRRQRREQEALGAKMDPRAYFKTAQYREELRLGNEIVASMRRQQVEANKSAKATGAGTKATKEHAKAIGNAGFETKGFTDAQNALHSALRGVGGTMGGLWLTYGKYVSVMLAAGAATKVFKDSVLSGMDADFQAQFVSVLQTKGPLDASLKNQIRDGLIEVSRASIYTTQENAEALKKLALAGIEASRGLKLLETASNAALFSQTSLGDATTMILDSLNNFGLASENSLIMAENFDRVGNVIAYTANTVNASFSDIAKSIANVTGVAGTFKVEIEEVSVLLQSMARAGIRGQKAGTYLRNFMDDLLGAPTSQKAEKKLAELGIERYDADANGEGEFGVARYIDNLVAKLRELTFVEQQNAIKAISNQRSRRVLRQELNEYTTVLERVKKLAVEADGSLARLSAGLSDNAQMAFKMAQAAYNATTTSAFAGNEEQFKRIGQDLQQFFNSEGFADFAKGGVEAIGSVAEALTGAMKFVVEFKDGIAFMGETAFWTIAAAGVAKLATSLKMLVAANPVLLGLSTLLVAGTTITQAIHDINEEAASLEGINKRIAEAEASIADTRERLADAPDTNLVESQKAYIANQEQLIEDLKRQKEEKLKALSIDPDQRATIKSNLERLEKDIVDGFKKIREAAHLGADGKLVTVDVAEFSLLTGQLTQFATEAADSATKVDALSKSVIAGSEAYALYAKAAQEGLIDKGQLELARQAILGLSNEYTQARGEADQFAARLDKATDRFRELDTLITTSGIREAIESWNKANPENLIKISASDIAAMAERNEALREEIKILEMGEDGAFRYAQKQREAAAEAIQTQIELLEASRLLAGSLSGEQIVAINMQIAALRKLREVAAENIDLEARKHDLDRSGKGGGSERIKTALEAAKTAIQDYRGAYEEALQVIKDDMADLSIGPLEAYERSMREAAQAYEAMFASIAKAKATPGLTNDELQKLLTEESRLIRKANKETGDLVAEYNKILEKRGQNLEDLEVAVGKRTLSAAEAWLREYANKYGDTVLGIQNDIASIEGFIGPLTEVQAAKLGELKAQLARFSEAARLGSWAAGIKEDLKLASTAFETFQKELNVIGEKSEREGIFGAFFGTVGQFNAKRNELVTSTRQAIEAVKDKMQQAMDEGDFDAKGELALELRKLEASLAEAELAVDPTLQRWGDSFSEYLAEGIVYGFDKGESPAKAFGNFLKQELVRAIATALKQQFLLNLSGIGGGGQGVGGLLNNLSNGQSVMKAGGGILDYGKSAYNYLAGNTVSMGGGALYQGAMSAAPNAAMTMGQGYTSYLGATGNTIGGVGTMAPAQASTGLSGAGMASAYAGGVAGAMWAYNKTGSYTAGVAGGVASMAATGAATSMMAGGTAMSGASAAMASIPVWGWVAMAAVAILGDVFNKAPDPRMIYQMSNDINAPWEDGVYATGAFGNIGMHSQSKDVRAGKFLEQFKALAALDDLLASAMTDTQVADVKAAMDGWNSANDKAAGKDFRRRPELALAERLMAIAKGAGEDVYEDVYMYAAGKSVRPDHVAPLYGRDGEDLMSQAEMDSIWSASLADVLKSDLPASMRNTLESTLESELKSFGEAGEGYLRNALGNWVSAAEDSSVDMGLTTQELVDTMGSTTEGALALASAQKKAYEGIRRDLVHGAKVSSEDLAKYLLQRLRVDDLQEALGDLGQSIDKVSAMSWMDASKTITTGADGKEVEVDGFTNIMASLGEVWSMFYASPVEAFKNQFKGLEQQFKSFGIDTVPSSISQYKQLLEQVDLNTEAGRELYASYAALAPAFLEVAGAVEAVFQSISQTTASSIRDIEMGLLDNRGKYEFLDVEISGLLEQLSAAVDPQTINELFEQANSKTMEAYNLLDDDSKKLKGGEFIDKLYELEALAQSRLSISPLDAQQPATGADEQAKAVESAVLRAMSQVVEQFKVAGAGSAEAAAAIERAAAQLASAVTGMPNRIVISTPSREVSY